MSRRQAGFTIIELLIATAVFSVILLVVTAGILQFSRQYYKGVVSSSTQGVARNLIEEVSQAIQFDNGTVQVADGNGFCIGSSKRYRFVLNKQLVDDGALGAHQGRSALVVDRQSNCSPASLDLDSTARPAGNAKELLGRSMRLSKFDISPADPAASGLYRVTVKVIYGDDDLLCSPARNECGQPDRHDGVDANAPDLTCRSITGSQYCAVSELTTTVRKRIAQ